MNTSPSKPGVNINIQIQIPTKGNQVQGKQIPEFQGQLAQQLVGVNGVDLVLNKC